VAAITGIGAVSALGRGSDRIWAAMAEGRDGLVPIARFDAAALGVRFAGVIADRNAPEHADANAQLCVELGVAAAREAWTRARLDELPRSRIALIIGTSLGEPGVRLHEITAGIATALGIGGPRITISTACASSANAIGAALELLDAGAADAVIAGGVDVLTPLVVAGFAALGVLAETKCAPFSEPAGTNLGEGAGFLVLERDHTRVPEAAKRYDVLGYGLSADAFHDTGPDPSGAGVARGFRAALTHAGIGAEAIDYVNAHGTGTRANDPAEWRAIQHVFGARSERLPVSSSKSFLGHGQGAAGVLEIIATLVAMDHGAIPPTQRYTTPRPNSPTDAVGGSAPRRAACDRVLAASSGFGGANCAVVLGTAPVERARTRRRVVLAGASTVDATTPFPATIDPRGLDPSTRFLVGAAGLALDAAAVRLVGALRDRSGVVVGTCQISPESDTALHRTVARHGYRGLSATLFARQVLNAPAGTCARQLGLRGATSTLTTGASTGLVAIAYAAELVATRPEVELIVAAGVDETGDGDGGAACAVLSAGDGVMALAGWAFAGPGELELARDRALRLAGIATPDHVLGPAAGAFASAELVVRAAALVRSGAHSVLVVADGETACAIVITGGSRAP
jgi:3-oxoacyl-[acyl-carrier-protein] synthase II